MLDRAPPARFGRQQSEASRSSVLGCWQSGTDRMGSVPGRPELVEPLDGFVS